MVFDWFNRGSSDPQAAAPPAPAAEEASDTAEAPQDAGASEAARPIADPVEPSTAPASATAAPGAAIVDEDALAWARQAYARLKAQQEAAAAGAPAASPPAPTFAAPPAIGEEAPAPPALPATEVAPPLAAGPPADGGASEQDSPDRAAAPDRSAAPLAAAGSTTQPPPAESVAPPLSAEPVAPLSLLEQAAAQREQRRQEMLSAASQAGAEPVAAEAPTTASPVAAAALADQAEPSLGAFDAEFTWSAEVLAAQGRRVEDVSLEEIDWLSRLRRGLEKTRKGFVAQLLDTLGDDPLSDESLEDIESTLLRSDVGVQATDRVLEALRQRLNEEVVDPAEGLRFLKEQLRTILEEPITASGHTLLAPQKDRLNVWLLVGVNGVGKTTTLGKLANLAVRSGYSCLIAAADTFRAAAVQQVSVWGERSGVPVVSNPSANADPAAVVYDAIGAARAKGTELVLVDTAGRLQTKHNLMEELSKVRRIVDKLAPEAVVESLLVLDASQGQNGLRQAMAFASAAGLTGVVLTKLDGSARGGVALAVASEARLPIRFIGAGETIRDLRPFNSFEFVEALLAS
jgi:fused signal recognition particle receptor